MKYVNSNRGIGVLAVILVLAVLAVVGAGVYKARQNESEDTEVSELEGEMMATTSAQMSGSRLRELFNLSRDAVCNFSGSEAGVQSSGTVYISSNMMRGDFVMKATSTGTINTHMVRKGNEVYVWTGAQGAKMEMGDLLVKSTTTTQSNASLDLDKKVDYKCESWSKDESKFALPTNIKFTDLSAMMKAVIKTNVNTGY